jgi:two-component system, cell cycle sensor histidine kinase and response regulator CckA
MKSKPASKKKLTAKKRVLHDTHDIIAQIMDTSPAGITMVDRKGYVIFANRQAEKIFGLTKTQISRRSYNTPKWHISDFEGNPFPKNKLPFSQVMSTCQPVYNVRHAIKRPDGQRVLLSINSAPVFDKSNRVNGMVSTLEDITDRVQSQRVVQEREEQYRQIFNTATVAIFQSTPDGKFIKVNPAMAAMFGYSSPDEMVSRVKNIADELYVNPADRQLYINMIAQEGKATEFICENYRKNRSRFWTQKNTQAIKDSKGKILYFEGFITDITERKRAEEALKASEEKYRAIIETTSEWIWEITIHGKHTFSNQSIESVLGYTVSEFIGTSAFDFMVAEDRERIQRELPKYIASKKGWRNMVLRWKHKNGTIHYLESNANPVLDLNGNVLGFRGADRDITDRIKGEESLRQSEEKFRALSESISDWIWEVDIDGCYTYSNPKVHDILGYTMEDVIGKTPFEFIKHDDVLQVTEEFKRVMSSEQSFSGLENVNIHKDGHEVVLETSGTPIFDDQQKLIGYRGIDRDITERKRAEEKLEKSEKYYRNLIDSSIDLITVLDSKGIVQYASPSIEAILGYTSQEYIGKNGFEILHPHVRVKIQADEAYKKIFSTRNEVGVTIESQGQHKNGTWRDLEAVGKLAYNPLGEPVFIASVRDITQRKLVEKELADTKAMLSTAILQTPVPMVLVSAPDCIIRLLNPACIEFLGVQDEPSHIGESLFEFKQSWQDYDAQGHLVPLSEMPLALALQGKDTKNKEYYVRRKDGTIRWETVSSSSVRNNAGDIFAAFLVFQDITEQKRTVETLRESEERMRAIIDQAPFGAHSYELQADGKLIFQSGNKSADRILSFDHSTIVGKSIEEAFPGLISTIVPEMYRRVAATGESRNVDQVDYDERNIRGAFELHAFQTVSNRMTVFFRDITERKRAEEALRESEERFRTTLYSIGDGVITTDTKGTIQQMNHVAEALTGWTEKDARGKNIEEVFKIVNEETNEHAENPVQAVLEKGIVVSLANHTILVAHDGTRRPIADSGAPIHNLQGVLTGVVLVFNDQTERKELQSQLLQAQKMEAIGRLAGGVAHDFNNMIGVILGYASLIESKMNPADPSFQKIKAIITAAERSANLTKQLLAFARKQIITPVPLNLNDEIVSLQKMLGRLAGEDVSLKVLLIEHLWNVKIDPVQITQVMTNLVSNARDAIENVGTITIETANTVIDESIVSEHIDIVPGEYVTLIFSDTGTGMAKETLEHIFEPFFTTKPKGKGTGLGLSTVFGIVKQNNGYINVYSEPGQGTTLKIYFPRYYGETETTSKAEAEIPLTGTETILIVEDETELLQLVCGALENYHYSVLSAKSPAEALELCEIYDKKIDLLITDVIMPGMNGKELKERIETLHPRIKTIFMSGYTADIVANRGILDDGIQFLPKPFTPFLLARKVRMLLNG